MKVIGSPVTVNVTVIVDAGRVVPGIVVEDITEEDILVGGQTVVYVITVVTPGAGERELG